LNGRRGWRIGGGGDEGGRRRDRVGRGGERERTGEVRRLPCLLLHVVWRYRGNLTIHRFRRWNWQVLLHECVVSRCYLIGKIGCLW
jgi:hypothetical protein